MVHTILPLRPQCRGGGTPISNDISTSHVRECEERTPSEVDTPENATAEADDAIWDELGRSNDEEIDESSPCISYLSALARQPSIFSNQSDVSTNSWKEYIPSPVDISAIGSRLRMKLKRRVSKEAAKPILKDVQKPARSLSALSVRMSKKVKRLLSSKGSEEVEDGRQCALSANIETNTLYNSSNEAPQEAYIGKSRNEGPQDAQIEGHRALEYPTQSQPLRELQAANSELCHDGQVGHPPTLPQSLSSERLLICPQSKHNEIVESVLAARKRRIVDRVMAAFEEMFGLGEDTSETDFESWCSERGSFSSVSASEDEGSLPLQITGLQRGDHNSDSANSVNGNDQACGTKRASGSAATKQSGKRRKTGGPGGSGPSDDEDEDNSNRKPIPQPSRVPIWENPGKRLACPYFRRNPSQTPRHTSCRYPGFTATSRVKEHLYRAHVLPIRCPRCHEKFDTNRDFTAHLMATERCPEAEKKLDRVDGLDQDQIAKLKKKTRAKADTSEEKKWRSVFQIVFPEVSESDIPSPYVESAPSINCPDSQDGLNFHLYEQLSRRELPALVRQAVEKEVDNETNETEEKLMSRLPEIVRVCQEQLFATFRAGRGASSVSADQALRNNDKRSESNEAPGDHRTVEPLEGALDQDSIERMFVEHPSGLEPQSAQLQPRDNTLGDDPLQQPRRIGPGDSGYRSEWDGSNCRLPALTHSATQSSQLDLDAGEGPSGYNSNVGADVLSDDLLDFDNSIRQWCLDGGMDFKFPRDGEMFPFADELPNHPDGDSNL